MRRASSRVAFRRDNSEDSVGSTRDERSQNSNGLESGNDAERRGGHPRLYHGQLGASAEFEEPENLTSAVFRCEGVSRFEAPELFPESSFHPEQLSLRELSRVAMKARSSDIDSGGRK